METRADDTDFAAKALELERFLPDGRQADFRLFVSEILAARTVLCQEQADLAAANRLYADEACRLRERLRRQENQLARLQEIFRVNDQAFLTFRSALTLSRGLRHLCELPEVMARLGQAMGVSALSCLLAEDDFAAFVPAGFPCPDRASLEAACQALPGCGPDRKIYVGRVDGLPRPDFFLGSETLARDPGLVRGSCFIAALHDKYRLDRRIGVLTLADNDPARYSSDKGTDFLEHFCEVLAGDLLNVKIHEELTRQREVDELTGVPNRIYLGRHGPPLLSLAERKGSPATMLFCDLDRFKAVNDTFGHEAGDAVLRCVGQAIAGRIRAYDILARLGGDEFVLLMPDAGQAEAQAMALRIRAAVAEVAAAKGLSGTPGLSVSIGMAMHVPGQGIDDLVRRADASMYADKRTGK